MLGIGHNPSTRSARKAALCLRLVILALLGALLLAAVAQADEASGGSNGVVSPVAAGAELPSAAPAPETGGGTTEKSSETKSSETVSTPPATGKFPETVSTPPATQTEALASDPGEKAPEAPKLPQVPKTEAGLEKEAATIASGPEKVSEDLPPPTVVDMPVATQAAVTRNDLGYTTPEIGYEAAPDVPGALINSPTDPPIGGSTEAGASEITASVAALAGITTARRAGGLSCELSSLGSGMARGCSAEWLSAEHLLPDSPAGYAAAVAALAPTTGTPPGGHGGAAVGSPPVSPGPGPAPSGAAGSSAGAAGLALAGFLTLAGLLLLGAPRAMRRLRLSCQPWLTACFVLIPERPG
jgi:hypothetical protein